MTSSNDGTSHHRAPSTRRPHTPYSRRRRRPRPSPKRWREQRCKSYRGGLRAGSTPQSTSKECSDACYPHPHTYFATGAESGASTGPQPGEVRDAHATTLTGRAETQGGESPQLEDVHARSEVGWRVTCWKTTISVLGGPGIATKTDGTPPTITTRCTMTTTMDDGEIALGGSNDFFATDATTATSAEREASQTLSLWLPRRRNDGGSERGGRRGEAAGQARRSQQDKRQN